MATKRVSKQTKSPDPSEEPIGRVADPGEDSALGSTGESRPIRPPAAPPERAAEATTTPAEADAGAPPGAAPMPPEVGPDGLDDDGYPVDFEPEADDGRVKIRKANQSFTVEPEMYEGVAYVELNYPLYGTDARRPVSRVWRRVKDGKKFYEKVPFVVQNRLPIHPKFR